MSKSVIFLSFDDHQTYEVNGTQAAFQEPQDEPLGPFPDSRLP